MFFPADEPSKRALEGRQRADATVTKVAGWSHFYGDIRMPVPGAGGFAVTHESTTGISAPFRVSSRRRRAGCRESPSERRATQETRRPWRR
jgi:hypothetical protein